MLNHNGIFTVCFNICKVSILPTGRIYGFYMILIINSSYYFLILKEKHFRNKYLSQEHTTESPKNLDWRKNCYFLNFIFRNVNYFPLLKAFEISNHIFCKRERERECVCVCVCVCVSVSVPSILSFVLSTWHSRNLVRVSFHFRLPKRRNFSFPTINNNSNKADARTSEILVKLMPFNTGA
jgi:hypothetical protein